MDPPPTFPSHTALQGKVVLVTGASSGLGTQFALDLARAGCRIVAAARRADDLRRLCDNINAARPHPVAKPILLDVAADETSVAAAVRDAWDAFGRIDALLNNAGVRGDVHYALDWPAEEWEKLVKTNLTGVWLVTKHVCARMRDAQIQGSVINITSITGTERGHLPRGIAYDASKTAANAATKVTTAALSLCFNITDNKLAQVLAVELGTYGIRVNAIAPGLFRSGITQGLMEKEWLNNVTERTIPLRTLGTSHPALTSLVRYLIHDASAYVSGNIFIVDSGATLPGLPIFSSL